MNELQESHILPSFVYRWMKETSATGYLRFGQQPNLRVQDGVKRHLLCANCEQRFNQWAAILSTPCSLPLWCSFFLTREALSPSTVIVRRADRKSVAARKYTSGES
jgi:hypothetical protein